MSPAFVALLNGTSSSHTHCSRRPAICEQYYIKPERSRSMPILNRIFNPATQLMQPPRGLEFDFTQPEGEQALICNASRRSCGNPTLRRPRQLRLESHGLGRTTMQLVRAIARLANRVPIPAAPPSKAFLRSVGRQPSFTHADLAKKLESGSRQGGGCVPRRKPFFLRRKPLRLVDLSS